MKATLIKKDNQYYCLDMNTIIVGTTNEEVFIHKPLSTKKLSKQNCDEIFGVVDVEKLGQKHYEVHIKRGHTQEDSLQRKIDFIIGFNQAMELNKDKVFTEDQMRMAYGRQFDCSIGEFIQSLQQPIEIEVEVEMESMNIDEIREQGKGFLHGNTKKPKLDENGCLILKKAK